MGTVVGVWRYPVKSAAAEPRRALDLAQHGVVGDREWAVEDEDGTLVSAKHPRRGGRLLQVRPHRQDEDGTTTLHVPGVAPLLAGTPEADHALSGWLGRPVRLRRDAVPGMRLHRRWPQLPGLLPEWQASATAGADAVTEVRGTTRHGSFVDYGAVHVVTVSALRRLAGEVGREVDPVRFRPNVVVDGAGEPVPGDRLRVGAATIRVELPTPRCVVPGLAHVGAGEDIDVLRMLARHERRQVAALGRAACLGFYATVEVPGAVRDGDAVERV